MRSFRLVVTLLSTILLLPGCGDGGSPTTASPAAGVSINWLGLPSAVQFVVHTLHDGTGWILNKNQVQVAKLGEVRPANADGFTADFQIRVTSGANSFETTAKDVPCDQDGIPTEQAVVKLRQAVEDIKAKIKRLQS